MKFQLNNTRKNSWGTRLDIKYFEKLKEHFEIEVVEEKDEELIAFIEIDKIEELKKISKLVTDSEFSNRELIIGFGIEGKENFIEIYDGYRE